MGLDLSSPLVFIPGNDLLAQAVAVRYHRRGGAFLVRGSIGNDWFQFCDERLQVLMHDVPNEA